MILAFMAFPPAKDGYGGAQRSWFLTEALSRIAPVHFVFLQPPGERAKGQIDFAPIAAMVESSTQIDISPWLPSNTLYPTLPRKFAPWLDIARLGTRDAPRLSRAALSKIASQIPTRAVDAVFAFRLPMGYIADQLIRAGLIRSRARIIDFDDIISSYRTQQEQSGDPMNWRAKFAASLRQRALLRAEKHILSTWDAVGACSDDDVSALRGRSGAAAEIFKLPNVLDRARLPDRHFSHVRLLFVGNLTYPPNVHGLRRFVREAWPIISSSDRRIEFSVVGLNPEEELRRELANAGIPLHANVPKVEPFYEEADVVIAPIFFGSGTRIKIIEAFALGRPVVSTTLGAEGLGVKSGEHLMLADEMPAFAKAILEVSRSRDLRARLAHNAREFQTEHFSPIALQTAVQEMFAASMGARA